MHAYTRSREVECVRVKLERDGDVLVVLRSFDALDYAHAAFERFRGKLVELALPAVVSQCVFARAGAGAAQEREFAGAGVTCGDFFDLSSKRLAFDHPVRTQDSVLP